MALSFPSSPSTGQTYAYNGVTYEFDGKRWKAQAQAVDFDATYATDAELASIASGLASKSSYSTTILSSDVWTPTSDYFILSKSVSGILSTDKPIVDMDLSLASVSNISDLQTAWSSVYRVVASSDTITFYALEAPSFPENLTVMMEVIR